MEHCYLKAIYLFTDKYFAVFTMITNNKKH